eukprot:scaffold159642_cov33-Tisochrysis_lutea.AAC.1
MTETKASNAEISHVSVCEMTRPSSFSSYSVLPVNGLIAGRHGSCNAPSSRQSATNLRSPSCRSSMSSIREDEGSNSPRSASEYRCTSRTGISGSGPSKKQRSA